MLKSGLLGIPTCATDVISCPPPPTSEGATKSALAARLRRDWDRSSRVEHRAQVHLVQQTFHLQACSSGLWAVSVWAATREGVACTFRRKVTHLTRGILPSGLTEPYQPALICTPNCISSKQPAWCNKYDCTCSNSRFANLISFRRICARLLSTLLRKITVQDCAIEYLQSCHDSMDLPGGLETT